MLGTKGVILVLGTTMAFGATMLGSVWHAVWAGIPLGLCVLAFTPPGWLDEVNRQVIPWRRRESVRGDRQAMGHPRGAGRSRPDKAEAMPGSMRATITTSRSRTSPRTTASVQNRTLVLDNLIHGYFILGHPERLDYDYEHIYALVAYRAAKAGGKVNFKPEPEVKETEEAPTEAHRRDARCLEESASRRGPEIVRDDQDRQGRRADDRPADTEQEHRAQGSHRADERGRVESRRQGLLRAGQVQGRPAGEERAAPADRPRSTSPSRRSRHGRRREEGGADVQEKKVFPRRSRMSSRTQGHGHPG